MKHKFPIGAKVVVSSTHRGCNIYNDCTVLEHLPEDIARNTGPIYRVREIETGSRFQARESRLSMHREEKLKML